MIKRKIFLTGSTGFIGKNLIKCLNDFQFFNYIKETQIKICENHVFHLAGKAHDLKDISTPEEYYKINTDLTKEVYDAFLVSNARVFITLSSVKAVADEFVGVLWEDELPNPVTHYGKSKLLAEHYIFSQLIPVGKRVYVLRPCVIYGPGNKGNLNLLYKIVSNNIPWLLGAFENKRSFCSIDNLMFIFRELIEREDIPSGIYNVADDEPLSTNELICLIAQSQNRKPKLWKIPKVFIEVVAALGDKLYLPLNTERLKKLTSSYVVSNTKIKTAIGKSFPVSSRDGLLKTFRFFNS